MYVSLAIDFSGVLGGVKSSVVSLSWKTHNFLNILISNTNFGKYGVTSLSQFVGDDRELTK